MKRFPLPLLALLLVLCTALQARDTAALPRYFDPQSIDLKALLPDPPAQDSPTTLKEIELILQKQQARTPEEVARIQEEVSITPYIFAEVLGPWFTAKDLPATAALFQNLDASVHPLITSAKKYWSRPRPFLQDSRVHPPIDLPKNASYPSGHSTVANLTALIIVELAPDLKDKILARGQLIGDDRVLAGVHFPSDVAAGKTLADDLFAKLMATPNFQADLALAKAEVASVRAKQKP